MLVEMTAAMHIVIQPPSTTFRRLAPRKELSKNRKRTRSRMLCQSGHFHLYRVTWKYSREVMVMVPVTANP
jgi:hypothetical protein